MISLSRIRLLIAFLLVFGFILVWQLSWRTDETQVIDADLEQRVDWFVNEAILTRYSVEGVRSSVTDAREVVHFEGLKHSQFKEPYSVGFNANQQVAYTLKADSAVHQDDNSRVDLADNVELHHNPDRDQALAMFTPSLTYFPEKELAVTSDPVEIHSSSGETHAIGMEFYTSERRMELLSKVRGNYVAAENQ